MQFSDLRIFAVEEQMILHHTLLFTFTQVFHLDVFSPQISIKSGCGLDDSVLDGETILNARRFLNYTTRKQSLTDASILKAVYCN